MDVFADTSALYAVLDRRDDFHEAAASAWTRLVESEADRLVTTSYVVVETTSLLQRRIGFEAARVFLEDMVPVLDVGLLGPAVHDDAVASFLESGSRSLSLVDCASFAWMRDIGTSTAFTFDAHFARAGFSSFPS